MISYGPRRRPTDRAMDGVDCEEALILVSEPVRAKAESVHALSDEHTPMDARNTKRSQAKVSRSEPRWDSKWRFETHRFRA
jgi:hypothetical protein